MLLNPSRSNELVALWRGAGRGRPPGAGGIIPFCESKLTPHAQKRFGREIKDAIEGGKEIGRRATARLSSCVVRYPKTTKCMAVLCGVCLSQKRYDGMPRVQCLLFCEFKGIMENTLQELNPPVRWRGKERERRLRRSVTVSVAFAQIKSDISI